MKRIMALLAVMFIFAATACSGVEPKYSESTDTLASEVDVPITIELWVFPIGNWEHRSIVSSILSEFNKRYPYIDVDVRFLDYDTGDAIIAEAIANGTAPDMIFEGPERLIVDYAANDRLVDISDIWRDPYANTIAQNIQSVCKLNGDYYMMPLCMQAQTMVINAEMFKACGAMELINQDTRTWTADDFFTALQMLEDWGVEKPCIIYCANQSGDQGTRMLVTNLSGGTFTNQSHTQYTVNSTENEEVLKRLQNCSAVYFEEGMTAVNAIEAFCEEKTAMSLCWNTALSMTHEVANQTITFSTLPVNFPTKDILTHPVLDGGVWGFCILDNHDGEKIQACKKFIREVTGDTDMHEKAVVATGHYPVISCKDVYINDKHMEEYSQFISNVGDFYQITADWTRAREAWWRLLQDVGKGIDPFIALNSFDEFLSSE